MHARARKRNTILNWHASYIRPVKIATCYIIYRLRCWNILLRNIVPLRIIPLHVLIFVLHRYVVGLSFFSFFFFFFFECSHLPSTSEAFSFGKYRDLICALRFSTRQTSQFYTVFVIANYDACEMAFREKVRNADSLCFSSSQEFETRRYTSICELTRRQRISDGLWSGTWVQFPDDRCSRLLLQRFISV